MPTWVANGTVWGTATIGDTLYVGGSFTELSPSTGGGIAADPSTGSVDDTLPHVTGTIRAVAPSPEGGWYLGGSFTYVGGLSRGGLAYIQPDGSVAGWNPKAVGGRVMAMALSPDGGTLYVGGSFTKMKGQSRARLAAFSTSTNDLTSWAPSVMGGPVNALSVSPDGVTVYVGGNFSSVQGAARSRLAAIDASAGSLSSWNPGANAEVLSLDSTADTVYVGGSFSTLAGVSRARVGAVATDGSPVSWTGEGADGTVRALILSGSRLFVGGDLGTLDGASRSYLGSVDASTGEVEAWDPGVSGGGILSLAMTGDGTTLFAGGSFLAAGGQPARRLAAVDTTSALAPDGWEPNPNATVRSIALALDESALYAGGSLTGAGGVLRSHLAAIDLATGQPTSWAPAADKDVFALAASLDGSTIYVGGLFTQIDGTGRNRLAALDPSTGVMDPTFKVPANRRVRSLATMDDLLFVGGEFTKLGGVARAHLGAIDMTTESLVSGWNPDPDGMVRSIFPGADGRLYVGGDFSSIGETNRDHVAALDPATGDVFTSFSPWGPRYRTFQVAADSLHLYAAMGGPGGGRLRAYDLADGSQEWEAVADGDVQAVTVLDGIVYIGGHFDTLLGSPRGSFGAADAATGTLETWNPRANGSLWTLASDTTHIFAGGDFTRMGTAVQQGVAAFA